MTIGEDVAVRRKDDAGPTPVAGTERASPRGGWICEVMVTTDGVTAATIAERSAGASEVSPATMACGVPLAVAAAAGVVMAAVEPPGSPRRSQRWCPTRGRRSNRDRQHGTGAAGCARSRRSGESGVRVVAGVGVVGVSDGRSVQPGRDRGRSGSIGGLSAARLGGDGPIQAASSEKLVRTERRRPERTAAWHPG